MKARVVILQDHLRGGGTERQSIQLTQALLLEGCEAHLVVGHTGGQLDSLAVKLLGSDVRFCGHTSALSSLRALRKLSSICSMSPTVIIAMGRWANCLIGLWQGGATTKTIATVRTSRPLPYLYRRAIKRSDAVLANSEWALRNALNLSAREKDNYTQVIYNALSRPELLVINNETKLAARRNLGIEEGTTVLLSAARMDAGKGQSDLIKMLALPWDHTCKLVLLGDGPERHNLEALAKSLGVHEKVQFIGFYEEVEAYYAAADIFVSASTLDSLPNALIEAQAAALPVIAYSTAGIPEIIEDGKTGHLVKAGDLNMMQQHIIHLIKNTSASEAMRQEARTVAIQKFDPKEQIKKYIKYIKAL